MVNVQIAKPRSAQKIINIVSHIRESIGLENELYFPVVRFAEVIMQQVDNTYRFIVLEKNEMPDKYAYYDPMNNSMVVRSDVYELACNGNGRHRFTIAHELGHYFLHKEDVKLARVSGGYVLKIYQNPEWQANTFASELLMPKKLIRGLNVEEIQEKCCTSGQAAEIALNKAKKPSCYLTF